MPGSAARRGGPGERAEQVEAVGNALGPDAYVGFTSDAIDYIEGGITKDEFDQRVQDGRQAESQSGSADWRIELSEEELRE